MVEICKEDGEGGMDCFFCGSGALGVFRYDSRVSIFSYSGMADESFSAFHVFCTVAGFSTVLTPVPRLYLFFVLMKFQSLPY